MEVEVDLRPQVVMVADLVAAVEVKLLVPVPELLVKVTMEEMEPTQMATAEVAEVALEPQEQPQVLVQLGEMAATV